MSVATITEWSEDELVAQSQAIGLLQQLDDASLPAAHSIIDDLEVAMLTSVRDNPDIVVVEMPITHHFAPGVYVREVRIPAGTLLTSRIHRTDHLCILLSGSISVWSEETGIVHLTGPFTFPSRPGSRRVGYAHTDVVWQTVHANVGDVQDVTALETRLYEPFNLPELPPAAVELTALSGGPVCQE